MRSDAYACSRLSGWTQRWAQQSCLCSRRITRAPRVGTTYDVAPFPAFCPPHFRTPPCGWQGHLKKYFRRCPPDSSFSESLPSVWQCPEMGSRPGATSISGHPSQGLAGQRPAPVDRLGGAGPMVGSARAERAQYGIPSFLHALSGVRLELEVSGWFHADYILL